MLGPGLSTFVGRERELEAITELLGGAPLVTLTGPGGSGKTRLALEAAERIGAMGDREVQVAELAALRDPALVPAAIADAFGLRASGSEAPLELLIRQEAQGPPSGWVAGPSLCLRRGPTVWKPSGWSQAGRPR